jgi:glutaredoxin 2
LQNLKNALSEIQQIIYQVKNNFTGSNLNQVAKYYQSRIKSFETYDNEGERIFKDWNVLNNGLFFENLDQNSNINTKVLPNKSQYIPTENLLKFITNDDIILYYIIEQFNMLLDINTNSNVKVNLAYLIINIVFQLFRNFTNLENAFFNINVKKFYHYISNKAEVSEAHDEVDFSSMTEEEIEKFKEDRDVDRERLDALDADQDETNEDFGDEDVIIHDRISGDY